MKRTLGSPPARFGGFFGALTPPPRAPRRSSTLSGGSPGTSCSELGKTGIYGLDGVCNAQGGSPCPMPDGVTMGVLIADGTCSRKLGEACGIVGSWIGAIVGTHTTEVVCAKLTPKNGDVCVIGGVNGLMAGMYHDPFCVDMTLTGSATHELCKKSPIQSFEGVGGSELLDSDSCLVVVSSRAYPLTDLNQPTGSVVPDASLCKSGKTLDFKLGGEALVICVDNAPKALDPCTANGKPGVWQMQGDGFLRCASTQQAGDLCDSGTGQGSGTLDVNLLCVANAAPKTGDPCDSGGGPGSGKVTAGGNCLANVATVPAEAHCPPEFPFYDPAIGHCLKASGDTSKLWNPICEKKDAHGELLVWDPAQKLCEALVNTPGDACTAPAGPGLPGVPGIFDVKGTCHPLATSSPAPAESSSKLPWILLAGTLAFTAYHLSTMKKRT